MAHIHVVGDTVPEVWERSVIECWQQGDPFRTEYDKPDDPQSKDCTALLVVRDPLREPRIHRAFPGGLDDLEIYRQEVLYGVHDHWVDPDAGKWSYTYHQRLTSYDTGDKTINQLDCVVEKLADTPHSRRAQAITWKPDIDPDVDDPACLQRMWFRIDGSGRLVLQVSMRSNDAFKAAFMNMFAFTELQKLVAERISERSGRPVEVGEYTHFANSYHIYGSYFGEFKAFLDTLETREFCDRVWRSDSDIVQQNFEYGKQRLAAEQKNGRD